MIDVEFTTYELDMLCGVCRDEEFLQYTEDMVSELINNSRYIDKLPAPNDVRNELSQLHKSIDKLSPEAMRYISKTFDWDSDRLRLGFVPELLMALEQRYERPKGNPSRRFIKAYTVILFDMFDLEMSSADSGKLYNFLEVILTITRLDHDIPALAKEVMAAAKLVKKSG